MSSANISIEVARSGSVERFNKTMEFIKNSDFTPKRILDLGPDNTFAQLMRDEGFEVFNTGLVDLDDIPETVKEFKDIDCITSFEIFEHLVAPYNVLRELPRVKMFISIPLRLWFSTAYNNPNDKWDRHYHEFEPWQFDWLLDKADWQIKRTEKWKSRTRKIGFRPILRRYTDRYYVLEVDPKEASDKA